MSNSKELLRVYVEKNFYPDLINFNFYCACGNERGCLRYEPDVDEWFFRNGITSYVVKIDFVEDTLWGLRHSIAKELKMKLSELLKTI